MIKLFVSDLDGTLLNEAHVIDEESAKVILSAQQQGYEFMIATGRHWGSVDYLLEDFGIKCKCILLNGAIYRDEHGNVLKEVPLDNVRARRIIDILEEYHIHAHYYTSEGMAAMHPEELKKEFKQRLMAHDHMSEAEVEEVMIKSNFCSFDILISDLDTYFSSNPVIYKLEAFSNDDEAMARLKLALQEVENIAISDSIGNNFELTDIHAQKGTMLEYVCAELSYDKNEVAVFGDSMNDLSMIKQFPHSYAMENGRDMIKDEATIVLGKNSEHAVTNEILHIMKNQG